MSGYLTKVRRATERETAAYGGERRDAAGGPSGWGGSPAVNRPLVWLVRFWVGAVVLLALGGLARTGHCDEKAHPAGYPVAGSDDSWAHVCPTDTGIYTARHVTHARGGEQAVLLFTSPAQPSELGELIQLRHDSRRDLALVGFHPRSPIQALPWQLRRASVDPAGMPRPGDTLLVQGFDHEAGWTPKLLRVTVKAVVAGTVIFEGSPWAGSSGSCLVLERTGAVVAINTEAGIYNHLWPAGAYGNYSVPPSLGGKTIGFGVLIAGKFGLIPDEWAEEVYQPEAPEVVVR